jgi:hypothetical protein
LSIRCLEHGTWIAQPPFHFGSDAQYLFPDAGNTRMRKEERLCLLVHAAQVLLEAGDGALMIIDVARRGCEHITVEHGGDRLILQLGSREWDCEGCGNVPLSRQAVRKLDQLKFARGGHRRNPWVTGEPRDPKGLALFCERVLTTGYGLQPEFELSVYYYDAAHVARLLDVLTLPAPRRS